MPVTGLHKSYKANAAEDMRKQRQRREEKEIGQAVSERREPALSV